jgi:hypothetical protein
MEIEKKQNNSGIKINNNLPAYKCILYYLAAILYQLK